METIVTINYSGETFKVAVKPEEFILKAGLQQGIDLPYSCQSGVCTTCRGKLLSGKVTMHDQEGLTEAEIQEGYILTCISTPDTDDVVIEIE